MTILELITTQCGTQDIDKIHIEDREDLRYHGRKNTVILSLP
jgi:hypothetical protein